jgi:hypothetical protein
MPKFILRFIAPLTVMGVLLMGSPVTVSAATPVKKVAVVKKKKVVTKKKVISKKQVVQPAAKDLAHAVRIQELADSTSKCNTPQMRKQHEMIKDKMEKDIEHAGSGHADAAKIYREKIALVWSAMEEPYCGFGSQGMSAVKHSYNKSVTRIRQEFLDAVK